MPGTVIAAPLSAMTFTEIPGDFRIPVAPRARLGCRGPVAWNLPGRRALWRLLAVIVLAGTMASCADCLFSIRGRVVECGTTVPVGGATISVRIDEGFHEGLYPKTFTTSATGDFKVTNDGTEACGAIQTLTITKAGFVPLSTQVTGDADAQPIELCMTRTASP